MQKKKRVGNLLIIWSAFLVCGIILFVLVKHCNLKIPCVFNLITGLLCPGCGNTRAVLCLSRLDFSGALSYNPMFFFEVFYILRVMWVASHNYITSGKFSYGKKLRIIDITALVAIIGWWIVRNII